MDRQTDAAPLLGDEEPAPFELVERAAARPIAARPIVFVCDHASSRVPACLEGLGLEERHLLDHIAWDIGAAAVARKLAEWFDAAAVLGGYSRLVADLNRRLSDASAFPEISDGVLVPGNIGLSTGAKAERARVLYRPYHDEIRRRLVAAATPEVSPVMIAVHSFTPRLNGIERPWHVGVLWDKDPRLPLRLIPALRNAPDIVVGDNEPYSGRHPADFTIDHHAEPLGIAHTGIEIRQDLIRDETGQMRWAERLAEALREALDDETLYSPSIAADPLQSGGTATRRPAPEPALRGSARSGPRA